RIYEILIEQQNLLMEKFFPSLFQLEIQEEVNDWPNCIGIVDTTEIIIQAWQQQSFSGKKKNFTLKYQVIINFSGKVLNIYGPSFGSLHDVPIWHNSNIGLWLIDNNKFVLGDKGYIGCGGVIYPEKKNFYPSSNQYRPLSATAQIRNRKISQ